MEFWKDIKGYEGIYQVSNLGKIKSLYRIDNSGHKVYEKVLKTKKRGLYVAVDLHKEGGVKTFSIHRLVADAFISNPNNLPVVNHIDEDKDNNKAENLEWCTVLYNNTYGTRMNKLDDSKNIPVYGFKDKPYKRIIWFKSVATAAKFVQGDQSGVSHVLTKRYKTHMGWRFEYADKIEKKNE